MFSILQDFATVALMGMRILQLHTIIMNIFVLLLAHMEMPNHANNQRMRHLMIDTKIELRNPCLHEINQEM